MAETGRFRHAHTLVVLGTLSLLALYPMQAASPETAPQAKDRILAVAHPALRKWIAGLAPERARDFGFPSLEEARRAELQAPIPLYSASRHGTKWTRTRVESLVQQPPGAWIVPVSTQGRVVSLITVSTRPGGELEVVELGKSWMANRLEAGLVRLEREGKRHAAELRFLAFVSPNMDLLLSRQPRDHGWTWLDLTGTTSGSAEVLDERGVDRRLQKDGAMGSQAEP